MNPAKHYYEEFHRINPPKLGQYINPLDLTKRMHRQLNSLNKEYLSLIATDINHCKHKNGEIFVPSPWHAWVLIRLLFYKISDSIPIDTPIPNNFTMPVYRGQSNANKNPIPSLYRPDTNREFEIDSLNAFTFIFNQCFLWQKIGISPSENYAKAAAQHYGIKTDLLDITANPSVALHFANRSKTRKRGDRATVFIFDLGAFSPSEVKLILPPPLTERLYLQRGGFLAVQENNIPYLTKKFFKIVFPIDPNFKHCDYEINENILLYNEWMNNIVHWSKKRARSHKKIPTIKTEIDKLLIDVFEEVGYPNVATQSPLDWFMKFQDILYWYAIRIQGNKEALLPRIRNNISQNNPDLIRFAIKYYEAEIKLLEQSNSPAHEIETKKKLQSFWSDTLNNSIR